MPLANVQNQVRPIPQHSSKRRASEGSVPREEDAQYWREMFWSLQKERVTEAEAQLYAFSEESEKREASLKAYIKHLETQLHDLREAGKQSLEVHEEMEEMRSTIKKQKHEIELHRTLTASTLSNIDETKKVACDCTVTNPESDRSTSFRLASTEGDDKLIKYEPLRNSDLLPVFLQEAIEFDATQGPALMQTVLSSMFPDED